MEIILIIYCEILPTKINRYIEPFVGRGAVYLNLNIKNSIINDKSEELMNIYMYSNLI